MKTLHALGKSSMKENYLPQKGEEKSNNGNRRKC
jgi:hypothetical protein